MKFPVQQKTDGRNVYIKLLLRFTHLTQSTHFETCIEHWDTSNKLWPKKPFSQPLWREGMFKSILDNKNKKTTRKTYVGHIITLWTFLLGWMQGCLNKKKTLVDPLFPKQALYKVLCYFNTFYMHQLNGVCFFIDWVLTFQMNCDLLYVFIIVLLLRYTLAKEMYTKLQIWKEINIFLVLKIITRHILIHIYIYIRQNFNGLEFIENLLSIFRIVFLQELVVSED